MKTSTLTALRASAVIAYGVALSHYVATLEDFGLDGLAGVNADPATREDMRGLRADLRIDALARRVRRTGYCLASRAGLAV